MRKLNKKDFQRDEPEVGGYYESHSARLTIKEAAGLIDGLTEFRVRQMCISGQLPCFMAGRKYLIYEEVKMSLPEHIEKEVAMVLLANIIALSETEEGKKMFENWEKQEVNDKEMLDTEIDYD